MLFEIQQTMRQFVDVQAVDMTQVSQFTPADFRTGIQWLLSEDKIALAQALADAGLSLHPESEDVLAVAGLLAAAQQDWPLAIELLKDLRAIQGDSTQPMTYQMLARAQYCNLDVPQARQTLEEGLMAWPSNPLLLGEMESMQADLNGLSAATQIR